MLADVTVTPVFTVFERTQWAGEVSEVWKWENVTPIFKKAKKENPRNSRMNSLTSMPRKVIEKLILENISKKVIESSQYGFTNAKSCHTNLIAF